MEDMMNERVVSGIYFDENLRLYSKEELQQVIDDELRYENYENCERIRKWMLRYTEHEESYKLINK